MPARKLSDKNEKKSKVEDDDATPVYLRCSHEERANWEKQAELDGFRNFSDWLRHGLNKLSREAREARKTGKG